MRQKSRFGHNLITSSPDAFLRQIAKHTSYPRYPLEIILNQNPLLYRSSVKLEHDIIRLTIYLFIYLTVRVKYPFALYELPMMSCNYG